MGQSCEKVLGEKYLYFNSKNKRIYQNGLGSSYRLSIKIKENLLLTTILTRYLS